MFYIQMSNRVDTENEEKVASEIEEKRRLEDEIAIIKQMLHEKLQLEADIRQINAQLRMNEIKKHQKAEMGRREGLSLERISAHSYDTIEVVSDDEVEEEEESDFEEIVEEVVSDDDADETIEIEVDDEGELDAESVKAFDAYFQSCVVPLSVCCDSFDDGQFKSMGEEIKIALEGTRGIIVLASRAKKPSNEVALTGSPFLQQTQTAVEKISKLRLKRKNDLHQKVVVEMMACCSWVLHHAPQKLPASTVKEALVASEFWLNRIRKDNNKNMKQLRFCNQVRALLSELVTYIEIYHKTGLTWNEQGVAFAGGNTDEKQIKNNDDDETIEVEVDENDDDDEIIEVEVDENGEMILNGRGQLGSI